MLAAFAMQLIISKKDSETADNFYPEIKGFDRNGRK